jgi:tetratricopeptide (TPR) repeat protein
MPLVVAGVALLVQAVYLAEAGRDPTFDMPIVDAATYHAAASRFANGGALSAGAFWQPPLFPLALGLLYRVAGESILTAKVVLELVGVASCVMVWWLAARLFTRRLALLAGLMLAGYGPFVFFSTQLLPAGLATALNLLALVLWIRCMDDPRWWRWLLLGLSVGAATITVPNSAVLLVLAVIWIVAFRYPEAGRGGWRPSLAACALVTAGSILPIGAVTARNYFVSQEWVLISTNGGINFYIGNNPRADETVAIRPGEYWRRLARESFSDDVRTRADQSRYFFRKALSYAYDQPIDFLAGLGRKTLRLANAREIPRNVDPYVFRDSSSLLSILMWRVGPFAFPFGLIAPFAVLGAVVSLKKNCDPFRPRLALAAFVIAYGGSVVLFFVSARYRLPVTPVIIIFAAAGFAWVWEQLVRHKRELVPPSRRAWAAVLFLVTALVVNMPISAPADHVNFRAELYLGVGEAHARQGELDEAERYLRDALRLDPECADACNKLAHVLARGGKFREAEMLLNRALALDPGGSEARWLLGDLLRREGRATEAIDAFEAALAVDPYSPEANAGLADVLVETGRPREAIVHYREAARLADQPGWILIRLGDTLAQEGEYEEAIEHYRHGLWQIEPDPATFNRIAWLLATCPRVELRDCKRAIEIAKHVCEVTEYMHPVAMDTLAAAYAECGQLDQALRWVQRAIEIATANGDAEQAESFLPRLEAYRAQRR